MNPNILNLFNILKIINIMMVMFHAFKILRKQLRRRWWIRPINLTRKELGFQKNCFDQLKIRDEEHFFKATRMTVSKFSILLSLLNEKLQRFSKREPINAETRLGITLMYLSQGCCPQFLAWSHKIGVSTVRKIIYDTCDAIWGELHVIYVAPPNTTEMKSISDRFYVKSGMPHCLSAIDGKHVNIICPRRSGSLFYNYKKTFSIVLMAACDSDYTFTYVDVGALGSQSDGGVFARSTFGNMISRNNLTLPFPDALPGSDQIFQYFFVGDNAFPLQYNLMRPYPGRRLTPVRQNFNQKLSSARVYIENSFGILATRWRVLQALIYSAPKNVDKIVLATIVLHNYLMFDRSGGYLTDDLVDHVENGVLVPGTWRNTPADMRSNRMSQSNRSSIDAFASRDELADFLFNN